MRSEAQALALAWRVKGARLHETYKAASPNLALHVLTALETCAEELEDLVKAELAKGMQDQSVVTSAATSK